jgi:hypothetical protein
MEKGCLVKLAPKCPNIAGTLTSKPITDNFDTSQTALECLTFSCTTKREMNILTILGTLTLSLPIQSSMELKPLQNLPPEDIKIQSNLTLTLSNVKIFSPLRTSHFSLDNAKRGP